jgi:site-specific DNA recombinase
MPRAIIYTRVSSDSTGRGRSVTEQETECRALCETKGWPVANVFTDNDIGASRWSRKDRPAYRELSDALLAGDVLVTWEASRAQRDLSAYVELRDLCAERGVLWCYSGRTYDLSRGDDRFSTGLDALLSEKEAEQTRERVLRGVRANAAAGRPHGRLPYGYRIIRNPTTGEAIDRVPDEAEAPIVREIVRRSVEGESMYSITADLNARGVPAPRPRADGTPNVWAPSNARRMVSSPTYIGKRTHHGQIVGDAVWEPIVSAEDYEAMMAVFADPARKTTTGHHPRWLLSGIVVCGACGGKSKVARSHGYTSYTCKDGFHTSRRTEHMDRIVTKAVVDRLKSDDILASMSASKTVGEDVMAEAKALRARLDAFVDNAADGELSPAALARIEAKLLPQIADAERRARSAVMSPLLAKLAGPDAERLFAAADIMEKREAITALVRVVMRPTRKSKTFDPTTVDITFI